MGACSRDTYRTCGGVRVLWGRPMYHWRFSWSPPVVVWRLYEVGPKLGRRRLQTLFPSWRYPLLPLILFRARFCKWKPSLLGGVLLRHHFLLESFASFARLSNFC
ncbi:hypothetical protein BDA96_04G206900 [Sorghum bicolor]|uniref:Uncharacterized protein n=2 Tax=Sorghum bicolor TaxID=4558 RepID=A0A921UKZ8_SORBI|nr:hypothetical protein BDA96_04G206900 [Sorghum bicolor]KXG30513.1 hypothetical protein SORBI_3004G194500 [Sorghum bicolor]